MSTSSAEHIAALAATSLPKSGFIALDDTTCIFGQHCFSGSQPEGPNICNYCKNVAVPLLRAKAIEIKRSDVYSKIDKYKDELYEQQHGRIMTGRPPYFCITKDP